MTTQITDTTTPAPTKKNITLDRDLVQVITDFLDDHKITDIVTINLTGKTSIADALVIASGRSQKHISMIAQALQDHLKQGGLKYIALEGLPNSEWVLIDTGTVIVHLFCPHNRSVYGLEKMWGAF